MFQPYLTNQFVLLKINIKSIFKESVLLVCAKCLGINSLI